MKPQEYEDFKRNVFSCLKDLTSHDPKLREEKSLRILEIGAGIGRSLLTCACKFVDSFLLVLSLWYKYT